MQAGAFSQVANYTTFPLQPLCKQRSASITTPGAPAWRVPRILSRALIDSMSIHTFVFFFCLLVVPINCIYVSQGGVYTELGDLTKRGIVRCADAVYGEIQEQWEEEEERYNYLPKLPVCSVHPGGPQDNWSLQDHYRCYTRAYLGYQSIHRIPECT